MDKIDELLTRRVDKIYPSKEALEKVLRSGKKLRLYQGFDPSTPNLHIGHLVGLLTLKEFQQLGHEVIFLIGDFTGMIGDPTGKIKGARPQLTHKQVLENAKTYKQQAGIILNFSGKNPIKIKFNSQWLTKLKFVEIINLMHHLTYAQIIKRDMFQQRIKEDKDIYANEFLYPLLQGYDSVAMDVDLEIGGSDQMYNMLVGRDLMHKLKRKEKFVLTTKLLVDSQGNKIGKTEGNAINIINSPEILFGQIMSLTDDCILPCFELITEIPLNRLGEIKKNLDNDPMQYKKALSWEIIKMLHGENKANEAQKEFEKVHQGGGTPEKIPTRKINISDKISLVDALVQTKLISSRSEAKRLISQNAVEINGQSVISNQQLTIKSGDIIKVGKRKWVRIK